MEHQTIDWRCPVCCYGHEFVIDGQCNPRFIAVHCPMCHALSPLSNDAPVADDRLSRLIELGVRLKAEAGQLRWGSRKGSLTEAQRAEVERIVSEHKASLLSSLAGETCGLTEAQRATSERLLRLALEG